PLPSRVECERALPADWLREETVRGSRHRSSRQEAQIQEVAAIQRYFLHGFVVNHLADGDGAVVYHWRLGGDGHLRSHLAELERNILSDSGAYIQDEVADGDGLKILFAYGDFIWTGRK